MTIKKELDKVKLTSHESGFENFKDDLMWAIVRAYINQKKKENLNNTKLKQLNK